MTRLTNTIAALDTPGFRDAFKRELESLGERELPLQQGLTRSSHVGSQPPRMTILSVDESARPLTAKVGVFYSGIIAGCNCADDPTPVDELTEYCELRVTMNVDTGEVTFSICDDA